jgi:hypothetical protein
MGKNSTFLNNGINDTLIDQIQPPPPPTPQNPFLNAVLGESIYKQDDSNAVSVHEYYNVLNYGISEMNSSTTNTNALVNLITTQLQNNNGGILYFPNGTYSFDHINIVNINNITILGETMNGAKIEFKTGEKGFTFNGCQFCTIRNITIEKINDPNANFQNENLEFIDCFNTRIYDCVFRQGRTAVRLNQNCNQTYIKNCVFRNQTHMGILLVGLINDKCEYIYIDNCQFDRDSNYSNNDDNRVAIEIQNNVNNIFINNCFMNNNLHGIWLFTSNTYQSEQTNNICIDNCVIQNSRKNAIRGENIIRTMKLTNSILRNNGLFVGSNFNSYRSGAAISSPSWVDCLLQGNVIVNNSSTAIHIYQNCHNVTIRDNDIRGNKSNGIRCVDDTGGVISYVFMLSVENNIFGATITNQDISNPNSYTINNNQFQDIIMNLNQVSKLVYYNFNKQLYGGTGDGPTNNFSAAGGSGGILNGGSNFNFNNNCRFTNL